MNKLLIAVLSLIFSMNLFAEKVTTPDGRELEGKVFRKNGTVTVITEDEKIFQFNEKVPNPVIRIKTSVGDIECELFENEVPNTVANIISLTEEGFYKGMSFHRIIPGFMAQGGCPNSKKGAKGTPGSGGPGYTFDDEFVPGLKHTGKGILSMANSGPGTNGSQFFLCFKSTPWLDGKHTVFGKVTKGLEVLKKLEATGTQSGKPKERIEFDIEVISKNDHKYNVIKN